jgi:hypothetical protein
MSPRWGFLPGAMLWGFSPGRYTGYINVAPLGLAWGDALGFINVAPLGLFAGATPLASQAPSVSIIKAWGNAQASPKGFILHFSFFTLNSHYLLNPFFNDFCPDLIAGGVEM